MKITGITIGDPFGIGPEIVEKAVQEFVNKIKPHQKIIIFGSRRYLKNLNFSCIDTPEKIDKEDKVLIFDNFPYEEGEIGKPSESGGRLSFLYLKTALDLAKKGLINSLITGPISKLAWKMAGIKYTGHTDFLKDFFGCERVIMSFWSSNLKVALFTHHIPLKKIFKNLKREELEESIKFLFEELQKKKMDMEVIVAGLNPHAGEEKTIGEEEERVIKPVIDRLQNMGYKISGPYPSDSLFYKVKDREDAIVFCIYHDQALIPFKLLHFEDGFQLTLGIPILRLSPVHGTAFDIAGKGIAHHMSMLNCLLFAEKFGNFSF